jgi:hypothetical protein
MARFEALVKHLKDHGASLAVIADFSELVAAVNKLAEQVGLIAGGIACQEVILEHHNLFNPEVAKAIAPKVRAKLGIPEPKAEEPQP